MSFDVGYDKGIMGTFFGPPPHKVRFVFSAVLAANRECSSTNCRADK
jgi:hypothetical protein